MFDIPVSWVARSGPPRGLAMLDVPAGTWSCRSSGSCGDIERQVSDQIDAPIAQRIPRVGW